MAAVWTRRREDVGGLQLVVRGLGAEGPGLILLHGLGVSGAVWQGVGRLLGPTMRLVAPDLRGHGESDKPSAGYLPRDYVGDLAALLGHEPSRPLGVLGHSLGAVIAVQLAAERPELVPKLILVDPPFDPERRGDLIETVERLRKEPRGVLELELQRREPRMGDPYARAMADLFRSAADGAFMAVLRAEAGFPSIMAQLPNIKAPTLVVAADPSLDGSLGPESAERITASLQNGRLLTIEGASHAVHASKPRELAQAVARFLRA